MSTRMSMDIFCQVVVNMLSSQIYLTTHYTPDLIQIERSIREKKGGGGDSGWLIPDTEVFSLFQAQRANIMHFLDADSTQCNETLEQVVRTVPRYARIHARTHACMHLRV